MRITTLLVAAVLLFGCSKVDLEQYIDNEPKLDILSYFQGKTTGWGMVQDRSGALLRQFVVDVTGTMQDENTIMLDEKFRWSDGERSTRVWVISKSADGTYTGTADDVVGAATGYGSGNVLNWRYHLNVEVDGTTWKLHLDDWMFLQQDRVMINRTSMSKFGFHVGDITIAFTKD
jgi:hypothetical protein